MSWTASEQTQNQRYHEQHYENVKQDFSDFGRTHGDTAEPEYRSDNRNDKKNDG